jgi:hypothetical protein
MAVDLMVSSTCASWRCPRGEKTSSCRLESPEVLVCTRIMRLVVPRLNTTGSSADAVRSGPEMSKIACKGVFEFEVIAIGNLAEVEVTVTVRPAGRPSWAPSVRMVRSGADRYAWLRLAWSPAVSASKIASSRSWIVPAPVGMTEISSASCERAICSCEDVTAPLALGLGLTSARTEAEQPLTSTGGTWQSPFGTFAKRCAIGTVVTMGLERRPRSIAPRNSDCGAQEVGATSATPLGLGKSGESK